MTIGQPVDINRDITDEYVGKRVKLIACPHFDQPRTGVIVKAMPKGVLVKHDSIKTDKVQIKGGTFGWAWDEVQMLSGQRRPAIWMKRDGRFIVEEAAP